MKTIIIEDEQAAFLRIKKMLEDNFPDIEVVSHLESVEDAQDFFKSKPLPELIISDIQLGDGSCFEVFDEFKPDCPIIFTTAFDEYAIKAFNHQAISYLLKPIKVEALKEAIEKLYKVSAKAGAEINYEELVKALKKEEEKYQKRYLIRYGNKLVTVEPNKAAYFYTSNKNNFYVGIDNKQVPLDQSLEKVEDDLDPGKYFRINRKVIVSMDSIAEMQPYSKSRVKLVLRPPLTDINTIVSTERSPLFKKWLEGSHK